MKGNKYLSELIDLSILKNDALNIVKAPTGSGKTYFALTAIPASIGENSLWQVVYLIDTINGKEQILQNYNAYTYCKTWDAIATGETLYWGDGDESVVIMTYAKFGLLLQTRPDFHTHFKYIICDELPSAIQYQYFEKRPNLCSIALQGLENAVRNDTTTVIALTATPNQIYSNFAAPCFTVPIDEKELRRYSVGEVRKYTNLEYLIEHLNPNETGMCYIKHIAKMKEIEAHARQCGLRPVCIWSVNNAEHDMTDEQLAARESILKDCTLPPQYNFLIINAASETSLKIKSPVDYVIIHSVDTDTQTQVRGRVNHDIDAVYIPDNDYSAIVPPESFLNTLLFKTDTDKLCQIINMRNECGRLCKWTTVKKAIMQNGYTVFPTRQGNARGYVIIPPD